MKKLAVITLTILSTLALVSCQKPELVTDTYSYTELSFPDYSSLNPVRYTEDDVMGPYNGWQNFGENGEIQTIPYPMMSTYTYQMYAYYLRTDLQSLYGDILLPSTISDLSTFVANISEYGSRILWYSMGRSLPENVKILSSETLMNTCENQTFLEVEYLLTSEGNEEQWIVFFMEEDGVFSSYSVRSNEMYDSVKEFVEDIVKTYQIKES